MSKDNYSPDYYLDVDDEMLDFLEQKGEQSLTELNNSYKNNKENGFKLLSILIVGIGASILMLPRTNHLYEIICLFVFSIGWIGSALNLTITVLKTYTRLISDRPPSYEYTAYYKKLTKSQYQNFKLKGYSGEETKLSILRRDRLFYLSKSFDSNLKTNNKVSKNINISIWIASLTPVASIISYIVTYLIV